MQLAVPSPGRGKDFPGQQVYARRTLGRAPRVAGRGLRYSGNKLGSILLTVQFITCSHR